MGYTLPRFIREPSELYHSKRSQYLTSHQLIDFTQCPLRYRMRMGGLIASVEGEALVVGQGAHTLTLEGRKAFESEFVVGGPENPNTGRPYGRDTKKYEEWAAKQGKPCLSDDQFALISQISYAVHSHPVAGLLLKGGVAEGVLRAKYLDVDCQVRLDWFATHCGLVDLKTCEDLDAFAADKSRYSGDERTVIHTCDCTRFNYRQQMAFYREVIFLCTGERVPVRLIAVEKKEPFRVAVYRISDGDLAHATEINEKAIRRLKVCRNMDIWPTDYEDERILPAMEISA